MKRVERKTGGDLHLVYYLGVKVSTPGGTKGERKRERGGDQREGQSERRGRINKKPNGEQRGEREKASEGKSALRKLTYDCLGNTR